MIDMQGDTRTVYNVAYDAPDGWRIYCMCWMDYASAERQLDNFKGLYLNEDGTGKAYPNGKGFYPFSNPRIIQMVGVDNGNLSDYGLPTLEL
jgi:hypothetical protein